MIDKLDFIIEISKSIIEKLKFDLKDPTEKYAVCFWGTNIELAYSISLLLKESPWGIESAFRTMAEGYVDLLNLNKDKDYYKYLEMTTYLQGLILENERKNTSNPYIIPISTNAPEHETELKKLIQKLKDEGINKGKTIEEKLKLIEAEDLYTTVYWLLCQEGHNNLSAIVERHFILDTKNNIQGIEFFRKRDFKHIIDTVAGILVASMKVMQSILSIDLNKEIKEAEKLLKDIRFIE